MVIRGFIHQDEAAEYLGLTIAGVKAAIAQGELQADREGGVQVSRASVERFRASRRHRFGALGQAAIKATMRGDRTQLDRLYAAAAVSVSSSEVAGDGGFAVPLVHAQTILTPLFGGFNLLAHCSHVTTPSNNISVPVDRRPPHDETSGVVSHWVGEGDETPESTPHLEVVTNKLAAQRVLVHVTEELTEDAPALGEYLETAAAEAIIWKGTRAVIAGAGGSHPLGFMNGPGLLTVLAEQDQASDTIVPANPAKMYARMATNSLASALWLLSPDALAQVVLPSFGQMYQAAIGGDDEAPCGRLLGRPIIPTEACEALGDLGDILFVDPSQYLVVTKNPALRALTSLHFSFDRSLMAFRFTFRMAGTPTWSRPVLSRVGGNTRSPYIALAAR